MDNILSYCEYVISNLYDIIYSHESIEKKCEITNIVKGDDL
jgi:hypothetical protein